MTEENKVNANVPDEAKQKIETQNKIRFAIKKLDEMKQLFQYLEKAYCKNRSDRKQFRRDFISNDKFAIALIDKVIQFYVVGGNQNLGWEEKKNV